MLDFWYQDAMFYGLDVKTFQDGNGDGIGDFQGLIRRLPYLAGLGINCLWLQPFYPSPLRDDGYDVSDFYAIDPRLGTFGDFVVFLREAEEHGLRVIADLVVNHTSDEHPWFQSARLGRRPRSTITTSGPGTSQTTRRRPFFPALRRPPGNSTARPGCTFTIASTISSRRATAGAAALRLSLDASHWRELAIA